MIRSAAGPSALPRADDDRRIEYDAWAAVYPAVAHNPVMRAEQAVVEPLLRRLAPARALDVGTGSGRYLDVLASAGANVIGIDFSLSMLLVARGGGQRVCGQRGRRLICADARSLPIASTSVDLVNAALLAGDIADLAAWSCELARPLVPGGHLVYSDFHPNWGRFAWRRTFRDAHGDMHEVPLETHTIEQHRQALATAGFVVESVLEMPLSDDRDRDVRAFRARWGNAPVLVVVHATRR